MGVDPAASVSHIVISHWHDDHVRGISSVVKLCSSAKVSISSALNVNEFFALAGLYDERPIPEGSGIEELVSVLRHLVESGVAPLFVTTDRKLVQQDLNFAGTAIRVTVTALSPSDAAILQSKVAFASMFPSRGGQPSRIPSITPNQSCVAILVEIGKDILLLGSDLEAGTPNSGWSAVLTSLAVDGRIAKVFKVPHHGGASAHDDRVWTDLLAKPPYAILTPFRTMLPSPADIARIKTLTSLAFITGLSRGRRWRPGGVVGDLVEAATTSIFETPPTTGQIRLRKVFDAPDWTVELLGGAQAL
jgi:hypothetical protein